MGRLELAVITENVAVRKLYKKTGFKIEGMREKSLFSQGKHYDEYSMSKLITE
ncbi:MAG: hypothetical protein LBM95_08230 [Lactobacillales bacterium]|jgi:RimJ/RimL family protein N-acetyltransferase|nr:hypothetical protein [Lactobacillales bacterium]